jgi:hypothetical protein
MLLCFHCSFNAVIEAEDPPSTAAVIADPESLKSPEVAKESAIPFTPDDANAKPAPTHQTRKLKHIIMRSFINYSFHYISKQNIAPTRVIPIKKTGRRFIFSLFSYRSLSIPLPAP